MYALTPAANKLIAFKLTDLTIAPNALIFNTILELRNAMAYLCNYTLNKQKGVFEPRWKQECELHSDILCAKDSTEMEFQLDAYTRQKIEFFLEQYVVSFDPMKIHYFDYANFDETSNNIQVNATHPSHVSIIDHAATGDKLVAMYGASKD